MMKLYLTTFLFFAIFLAANAQISSSWNNSQDAINWLNENLAEVRQDKETYHQSIELNSSKDDFATLNIKETDAKGSVSTTTYDFYLGHIDVDKTRFSVKGTAINIFAETTNREKLIRLSKNGAFQVYKNELVIKCDDPQLAKDVVHAINFAITSSNYKALSFNNPSEAINWLTKEVKDFKLSESKVQQSFEYLESQRKKMVLKTIESSAKSNSNWEYTFYANDFSDLLGNISVSGEKFNIKFTTIDNQKMVKIFKDGEQQKFNKYFELSANDPKMAIDILDAFKAVFSKSSSSVNNKSDSELSEPKIVEREDEPNEKPSSEVPNKVREEVVQNNNKSQSIPEPDFNSRPYYLKGGSLDNFERVGATLDIKNKLYAGSEIFYTAFGKKSDVRFAKGNLPRIVIKIEGNVDPEELLQLVKAEDAKNKDRRRFKVGSRKMMGKSRDVSDNQIELQIKKVRSGIYEVIIDGIDSGEYAFLPTDTGEVSILSAGSKKVKITCFGID